MIIFIGIICFAVILFFVFHQSTSRKTELLNEILLLSKKELDLDTSILLIEHTREYTMLCIQQINTTKINTKFKELINQLLGMILQVPRIDNLDIKKVIEQVKVINKTSVEIQHFVQQNQQLLKKYSK